jgi:hypothetical protein
MMQVGPSEIGYTETALLNLRKKIESAIALQNLY